MSLLTFQQLDEAIHKYDLVLFDLWGVIIEGDSTYPGVVEAVNNMITRTNVMFLTNAPRPNFKVAENLRKWGITNAKEDMVVTSGDLARQMIQAHNSNFEGKTPKIYHLGEDRNEDILINFNHELTQDLDNADILLLSLYRDDHEDIHEFNNILKQAALKKDLLILCSNPDTTIPKHGTIRYCAGHFAEIIEKFGGEVVYTGKPKEVIYNFALQKQPHIKKERILMIGDTFETDILGANKAGIHSALVLSGNSAPFHNMHESMDDKLSALHKHAQKTGIIPSFVTSIV
ncbi:MAG: TIGR01459 family HAD-type hydrolase [Rickettsiaceae bacterium]|nr:TIGR01459 family HAD-type hydrolase [Rickettsiaceae bacterium]MDP4832834.1 TIGR01459 family HAD-type hydrolase [Rickettsiaceae bacterium]MDP5021123.1 TIGR01459 family HAD-type hydrolase [Rickettsiaceae bacterium]MDP5082728.1 TIGR01459 family HAD-type hydrolase [Rickettsiaceae bacterium]